MASVVSGILGCAGSKSGSVFREGGPTFLVTGASLWALLSETAKGEDIGRELRNVCGHKERGAVRRLRGPLQTNKQPSGSPTCFARALGLGGASAQQACGRRSGREGALVGGEQYALRNDIRRDDG